MKSDECTAASAPEICCEACSWRLQARSRSSFAALQLPCLELDINPTTLLSHRRQAIFTVARCPIDFEHSAGQQQSSDSSATGMQHEVRSLPFTLCTAVCPRPSFVSRHGCEAGGSYRDMRLSHRLLTSPRDTRHSPIGPARRRRFTVVAIAPSPPRGFFTTHSPPGPCRLPFGFHMPARVATTRTNLNYHDTSLTLHSQLKPAGCHFDPSRYSPSHYPPPRTRH